MVRVSLGKLANMGDYMKGFTHSLDAVFNQYFLDGVEAIKRQKPPYVMSKDVEAFLKIQKVLADMNFKRT